MRARMMVSAVVSAGVVLLAGACGADKKEDTDAKSSQQPSASTEAGEPSATPSGSASTGKASTGKPSTGKPPTDESSSDKPSTGKSSEEPIGDKPAPKTKAGAIQRYEQYLHALGREDIDTVCEVAGPAAKKAQDEGLGPCTSTYVTVFKMISPAQKKALKTATVDPGRVVVRTPAKVEMPVGAVKASVAFSESDLGDYTLEYLKNEWFITD